ncbi:uncharacterized protein LOC126970956 [Leptidea sinapis]|uniref:uncharacterized protein LOC126970956 n=1 Tax=Leptidea sinapis TaxID=189913 RepID=UPI00212AF1EB|nr:uncharacterized protein LOC126970956 [Leptidea sinapis]
MGAPLLATLACLTLQLTATRADIVFRVPTVVVHPISVAKRVGIESSNSSGGGKGNGSEPWGAAELELRYEEYFVEHDVSTVEARTAAALLRLDDIPVSPEGCGECTRREMEYCETRVLADHCCCERRFLPEPFPWLPHTCYLGPRRCRPLAHDCVRYVRLRDCCCYRHLAERWKGILSRSGRTVVGWVVLLATSLLMYVAYL